MRQRMDRARIGRSGLEHLELRLTRKSAGVVGLTQILL